MNNKEIIKKVLNETKPKKKYLNNAVMAFLFGGLIFLLYFCDVQRRVICFIYVREKSLKIIV